MQTNTALNNGEVEILKSHEEFASDVLSGLSGYMKTLPCKYIYDERGSLLFKQIMELPEYYLTRSEIEIFQMHKEPLADIMGIENCNIVELGAGDGKKTRVLLEQLLSIAAQFHYFPVDISESSVKNLISELIKEFPSLEINGVISDYFEGLRRVSHQNQNRNIILFLGSSIGNFDPEGAEDFFSHVWNELKDGDLVLTGFDLRKDIDLILTAYNDVRGITEQFNLNLLRRINNELGGNFDLQKFRYYGTWDPFCGALKSFLISTCKQTVHIGELDCAFKFDAWEPIHTESSYKFSEDEISALAHGNGFDIVANFFDKKGYFVDALWQVKKSHEVRRP
jgi:L-histidine N-alpha-methyltransferase